MSSSPQPAEITAPPPSQLPEEVFALLSPRIAQDGPLVCGLFSCPDYQAIHLNRCARDLLAIGTPGAPAPAELTLPFLIAPGFRDRFRGEILPRVGVFGRWRGVGELCDVRGGIHRLAMAVSSWRHHQAGTTTTYICLHALELNSTARSDSADATDHDILHALLDHLPDSVYFKDRQSRFMRVSRSMAERSGLRDPREMVGRTDFDFFTAEHAAQAFADEQRILRTGEPIIDKEECETWGDGHVTWVSSTKLPLQDAEGRLLGTYGVSRDITARKLAEREQRERDVQQQLASKLESIGMLAAGIAHEINTPTQFITDNAHFLVGAVRDLAGVMEPFRALLAAAKNQPALAAAAAAAEQAAEKAELDYLLEEMPRTLTQSLDGLARVARIVRSLKEFAHPNAPERTPADLNRAIETTVTVARHEWKYVAQVVTEFDPTLPPVPCVLDEFNQVILNLLVNASHAIGDVVGHSGQHGTITVRTRRDATHAIIEVADTGTGIPEAVRARIFDPFFTTKGVGKGTGQGLAIVRNVVVNHHGGAIEFDTEEGRGSTFRLRLPLVAAPTAPRPPTRPPAGESAPPWEPGTSPAAPASPEPLLVTDPAAAAPPEPAP